MILDNDGDDPVDGTFQGLGKGDLLNAGRYSFTVSYQGLDGAGNDVVLTATDTPPVASDVFVTTNEDNAAGLSLLAADAEGNPLTYRIISSPIHGMLTRIDEGTYAYLPDPDYNGAASFTFVANDGTFDSNEGVVSITVNAVNDIPTAAGQTVETMVDTAIEITLTGSDVETPPSGLVFTIASLPDAGLLTTSEGAVVQVGDAFSGSPTLIYTPSAAAEASGCSIQFTVTDGGDGLAAASTSDPAAVAIDIEQYSGLSLEQGTLRFGGTEAVDIVTSVDGVLVINGVAVSTAGLTEIAIWAGDGNDSIDLSGLDIQIFVAAGAGDDMIIGGSANDLILGGDGNDSVRGGNGHDFLLGGNDADRLGGGAENDVLASGDFRSDATFAGIRAIQAYWSDYTVSSEEQAE